MASLDWLVVSVTSFTIFQILFHYLSAKISACFCNGYRTLTDKQKIDWNSRVVSTVHAFLVGLLSLYLLWFDDAVNADPVCHCPVVGIQFLVEINYLRVFGKGGSYTGQIKCWSRRRLPYFRCPPYFVVLENNRRHLLYNPPFDSSVCLLLCTDPLFLCAGIHFLNYEPKPVNWDAATRMP